MTAEKQIDRYIASTAPFAQPICRKLRTLIHKADPGIVEDVKWGAPNFNKEGMICSFAAFKEHVSLGFFKGALLKDPKKLLEDCSGSNAHNRTLKFRSVAEVNDKALIGFVKQAVQLNEKGIKGEVRRAEISVPADLKAALAKDGKAKAAFEAFTPGRQREYLEWIVGAKRPETRAQRIETTVQQSREGKSLHWKYQK
jgi:uncharacterized protein YdeI (YjbR/CyaY-like superfamily)